MQTGDDLRRTLARLDGRSYRAYKEIAGSYAIDASLFVFIDHVQGDPFAAPSKLRLRVLMEDSGFPGHCISNRTRKLAFADYLIRQAYRRIPQVVQGSRGSGKSGRVSIDVGGQEVLERSAARVEAEFVELRITLGLPAQGRRVLGRDAERLLLDDLPRLAEEALFARAYNHKELQRFIDVVENQSFLREQLSKRGLIAFVANDALLPRRSGADDRPLTEHAVRFRAPPELELALELLHPVDGSRSVRGLGIPRGVTLIVGGGYHGKSTLLRAIERSVYPHVPGDGRELIVTDKAAVKIRAEDGRRIEKTNISGFIDGLPGGKQTTRFCSDDASGSTSQAASIIEAIEVGARVLLLDEDTSATNFMVRDARMQALVHADDEPITPFVDRVRELYEDQGVSTLLVMGGSGDYFDVADTVIMMRDFEPFDRTSRAKAIAADFETRRTRSTPGMLERPTPRSIDSRSLDPSRGRKEQKIDAREVDLLTFGTEEIDLRGVEQIVDRSQTRAIGLALALLKRLANEEQISLDDALSLMESQFELHRLDVLDLRGRGERHPGALARPRRFEVAAALNRLRTLRVLHLRGRPTDP